MPPAPIPAGMSAEKLSIFKDALYDAMRDNGNETRLYTQPELLELGIIPGNNREVLMAAIQKLSDEKLLKYSSSASLGLCLSWRSREDARIYASLNTEQAMVYDQIDSAGAEGTWLRMLRNRTRMVDSELNKRLRELEARGLIRDMKSVEAPNKKMYIKATLRPSERATGGPWYTDSTLDEAFIGELEKIIFDFVRTKGSYYSRYAGGSGSGSGATKIPKKGTMRGSAPLLESSTSSSNKGKKRTADAMDETEQNDNNNDTSKIRPASARPTKTNRTTTSKDICLPMPAGYKEYAQTRQIAEYIHTSGITNNTALSEADVQQLVDILVYDGILEPVELPLGRGTGYRPVAVSRVDPTSLTTLMKRAAEEGDESGFGAMVMGPPVPDNGYTEAPCGRCPVFDLCEEGGPVSPSNCVYFARWLGIEEPAS